MIVLSSVARACVCDDQCTVHTQLTPKRLPVLRVCAMFEVLREFASYVDLIFVPLCWISSVVNRVITLLLLVRRCMKSFSAFFNSEYSRARPSTASQFS